jgi:hypothetical protein
MRPWPLVVLFLVLAAVVLPCTASRFVVFPKAGELPSPDGRFVVRNADRDASASEFVGTFHALWLVEIATGRSRKLCDYLGVAAVAWSNDTFIVVTEYAAKRTSRALVFSATDPGYSVALSKSTLTRVVGPELRASLEGNDHVFVEASRVEDHILHFRVWGYGQHDASGFRWHCEYGMRDGAVFCDEVHRP